MSYFGSVGERVCLLTVFLFLLCLISPSLVFAGDDGQLKDRNPERGIVLYADYTGLVLAPGESVRMKVTVENKGASDENVLLSIPDVPATWKAALRGAEYVINSIPVAADTKRVLTFAADPAANIRPGSYRFRINARTEDGKFTSTQVIKVTVQKKAALSEELQVSASYPVLKGATDTTFEFTVDVINKSENERNVNLTATAPPGWDVGFKPFNELKQISSLRVKGGHTETLSVQVKPSHDAQSGSYPIIAHISSDDATTDVKLSVVLTGTYSIEAGTPSGLLSLDAYAGKPANLSIYVRNTGSAVNHGISLSAFKPENWKVEFNPASIESLAPGEVKQVEVTILPALQALVGDYSVSLIANGELGSVKTVEIRTSVKTPATWGWVGIFIIMFVIAGLGGLFLWLGRR